MLHGRPRRAHSPLFKTLAKLLDVPSASTHLFKKPTQLRVGICRPCWVVLLKNLHFLQHPPDNSPKHAVAPFGVMHLSAPQHRYG